MGAFKCEECCGTGVFDMIEHDMIPCVVCEGTGRIKMSAHWFDTGTDEAKEFSLWQSRPVISVADGVIGYWRELEEGESALAAFQEFVSDYEGEWKSLEVRVYERGEITNACVYPR